MAEPKLTWLIETDVYGEQIKPLVAEIKRQGFAVHLATFREIVRGTVSIPADERVLFYGTFPAMRHIQLQSWSWGR
ncbi:MAG: hypothetical protein ACFCD0_14420 [Gemmataceae bacterium]